MKIYCFFISLFALTGSIFSAEVAVTYKELLKIYNDDSGDSSIAYGKTVEVSVTGKGELGYFVKGSDGIRFVCKTGDKTLTANRATKSRFRGLIIESQPWEGATVYQLKDCQFVKPSIP